MLAPAPPHHVGSDVDPEPGLSGGSASLAVPAQLDLVFLGKQCRGNLLEERNRLECLRWRLRAALTLLRRPTDMPSDYRSLREALAVVRGATAGWRAPHLTHAAQQAHDTLEASAPPAAVVSSWRGVQREVTQLIALLDGLTNRPWSVHRDP